MLILYALCCLPLLAHALTREQIAQFTGGCSSSCTQQSPCGETSMTGEDREILRLTTNGIPNHPSQTCNGNSTKIQPTNKIIEFPNLTPERFEQFGPGDAKYCTPNIVGYAKNGIPFYSGNNTDCKNGINPVERIVNNGVEDLWAFDTCAGHATVFGVYHYRCNPRCLYNGEEDEFLGVAVDGYPIYGARVGALGGSVATNAALDECHGGNWNDGIGYRYIVNNEYPYTVGCLRGELRDAVECGPDQGRGSLCLCSGGDYGSGYGGAYGGSGHSRRYKRGGGRWGHWSDSSSEEVEAQVFRFTALPPPTAQLLPNGELSPVGRCLITDACTFEEATVHLVADGSTDGTTIMVIMTETDVTTVIVTVTDPTSIPSQYRLYPITRLTSQSSVSKSCSLRWKPSPGHSPCSVTAGKLGSTGETGTARDGPHRTATTPTITCAT